VQELRDRGLAERGIILMGHSMGSVAVLRAAAEADDVAGVIVEAPYDTYRNTVAHHARTLYHIPSWAPIIPLAISAAEWRGGFDADEVDAVAAARRIRAPLLVIADEKDVQMPPEVVRRVYEAHPGPGELWIAPGVEHIQSFQLSEHWPRIESFLERNGI